MCVQVCLVESYDAPRNTPGYRICGATLPRPPEVKSCRITWCIVQREHILENRCDFMWFVLCSTSKDVLVCNLYRIRAFEQFIVHPTRYFAFYLVPRGMVYVII